MTALYTKDSKQITRFRFEAVQRTENDVDKDYREDWKSCARSSAWRPMRRTFFDISLTIFNRFDVDIVTEIKITNSVCVCLLLNVFFLNGFSANPMIIIHDATVPLNCVFVIFIHHLLTILSNVSDFRHSRGSMGYWFLISLFFLNTTDGCDCSEMQISHANRPKQFQMQHNVHVQREKASDADSITTKNWKAFSSENQSQSERKIIFHRKWVFISFCKFHFLFQFISTTMKMKLETEEEKKWRMPCNVEE